MNHLKALAVAACAALLIGGCSNPLIVTPVPEDLRGNMTFATLNVSSADGVPASVASRVKDAIQKQLDKRSEKGTPMIMRVTVNEWKGKDDALGGATGASLLGVQVEIKGNVKVVDPKTKKVVAEYGVMADYSQGGFATRTISFVDAENQAITKFATFTMLEVD